MIMLPLRRVLMSMAQASALPAVDLGIVRHAPPRPPGTGLEGLGWCHHGRGPGPKQAMASLRKANSGSFKVGNPGGGRPRGGRSRLQELAIEMLRADFEQNGADVIRRVRERKPEVYLASVVSLLPKHAG
jgi:hypothetical protein